MELAVCSAAISLLFLVACPFAFAGGPYGVSIKVFTSEDDQLWTNSVLIEGAHEVMLVDAQLTKTNVATSEVVGRIHKVYQEKIDKWKQLLGPGATTRVVPIEPFDGNTIPFESSHIEVLQHIQGDTGENTMLWIPGQNILVGGDVVFSNMHVYPAETDSRARRKWLDSLNAIRDLQPSVVVPGHSKAGAPLDASTAVDFTKTYLLAFEQELSKAKHPDSLVRAMKNRFPSADLLLAIERGAAANVKP